MILNKKALSVKDWALSSKCGLKYYSRISDTQHSTWEEAAPMMPVLDFQISK